MQRTALLALLSVAAVRADTVVDLCVPATFLGGATSGWTIYGAVALSPNPPTSLTHAFTNETVDHYDYGPGGPNTPSNCYMAVSGDICSATDTSTPVATAESSTFAEGTYTHLSFKLNMNGNPTNQYLNIFSVDASDNEQTIYTINGNLGDEWRDSGLIPIPANAVKVKFNAYFDDMWQGTIRCASGSTFSCGSFSNFLFVGDGVCNRGQFGGSSTDNAKPGCDWDGGDCCFSTCTSASCCHPNIDGSCTVITASNSQDYCEDPGAEENGGEDLVFDTYAIAVEEVTFFDAGGYDCESESNPHTTGSGCPSDKLTGLSTSSFLSFLIDAAKTSGEEAIVPNLVNMASDKKAYQAAFINEAWANPPNVTSDVKSSDGVTRRFFEFQGDNYLPTTVSLVSPSEDFPFITAEEFTFATWIKVPPSRYSATAGIRELESIVNWGYQASLDQFTGFSFYWTPGWKFEGDFRLGDTEKVSTFHFVTTPNLPSVPDDEWHFISAGTDGAGGIRVCIDLTCSTTNVDTDPESYWTDADLGIIGGVSRSNVVNTGQLVDLYDDYGFEGAIGMFALYEDRLLTFAESNAIFQATKFFYCSCPAGYVCDSCTQVACPAGYFCPGDFTSKECGGEAFYCPGGASQTSPTPVTVGYETIGGTSNTRTSEQVCEAGFYCDGGEKFECGSVAVFCPEESSGPTTIAPGFYGVGATSTTQFSSLICPRGHYCTGGEQFECEAGTYGATTGLTNSTCSGDCDPGFICPGASTSRQELPCGEGQAFPAAWYCPGGNGVPIAVPSGSYSTPESNPTNQRTGFEACPPENFCGSDGLRVPRITWTDASCAATRTKTASVPEQADFVEVANLTSTSILSLPLSYYISDLYVNELLCPAGYTFFDVNGNGQCLRLTASSNINFDQAASDCESDGGNLIIPDNYLEDLNVLSLANSLSPGCETDCPLVFLGITDEDVAGEFKIYDSDIDVIYDSWATGQPNSDSPNIINCVAIEGSTLNTDGNWTNVDCDGGTGFSGVCEYLLFNVSSDGVIQLNGPALDFESSANENLTFTVNVRESVFAGDSCEVTVAITDTNDRPVLDVGEQNRSVEERSVVNTVVGDPVTATDADAFDELSFSIIDGNSEGWFDIGFCTGTIFVRRCCLSFVDDGPFNLTIQVADSGDPTKVDVDYIVINVADVNDPPSFTVSDPVMEVVEGVAGAQLNGTWTCGGSVPCEVLPVSDLDENETFEWKIIRNDGFGTTTDIFDIDESTGEIFLVDGVEVDFEEDPSFSIDVRILDREFAEAVTTVTINVLNRNDAPALDFLQALSVPEDAENGDVFTPQFLISDEDFPALTAPNTVFDGYTLEAVRMFPEQPGGLLIFDILNTSRPDVTFTGTSGSLDFETLTSYKLEVRVTDAGEIPSGATFASLSGLANLTISITDTNEAPDLIDTVIDVPEDATLFSAVGNVTLVETDAVVFGKRYSFLDGTGEFDFQEASENVISVLADLDFETPPTMYQFTARVFDGHPTDERTDDALVTFNILDANDAPAFTETGYAFDLEENSVGSAGISGTPISCVDEDADTSPWGVVTYTYSNLSAEAGVIVVDANTGAISTSVALNFETSPSVLRGEVVCEDGGELFAVPDAEITINVIDVNDAPVLAARSFFVGESESYLQDESIGFIPGSDEDQPIHNFDSWGQLNYSLLVNPDSAFYVDSSSGLLFILAGSTFREGETANVTVQLSDGEGLTDTREYQIAAVEANLRPSIADVEQTIPENSAGDLMNIFAFDSNEEQTLAFTIGNCTTATFASCLGVFELVSNGTRTPDALEPSDPFIATLRLAQPGATLYSFEDELWGGQGNPRSVVLTVEVSDGGIGNFTGTLTATATITIDISDVPEPPSFASTTTFFVDENNAFPVVLGDINPDIIIDEDFDDNVTFSLGSPAGAEFVEINPNGTVTLIRSLDAEFFNGIVNIDVKATDSFNLSAIGGLVIAINDRPEAPILPDYNAVVEENEVQGSRGPDVVTLLASDPDNGQTETLRYSIINGSSLFDIDEVSGLVFATAPLDFEVARSYVLHVRATDQAGLTGDAIVTITVTDEEDAVIASVTPSSLSTLGNETLTISGSNLGPVDPVLSSLSNLTVVLESATLGTSFTAEGCYYSIPYSEIQCVSPPGGGDGLTLSLTTSVPGTFEQTVTFGVDLEYTAPTIDVILSSEAEFATTGGQTITIQGQNLGPTGATSAVVSPSSSTQEISVTYSNSINTYICSSPVSVFSAGQESIVCTTSAGVGVDFTFTVEVYGLSVSQPSQTWDYARPRIDTLVVDGVMAGANTLTTRGGEALDLLGINFGTNSLGIVEVEYTNGVRTYTADCPSTSVLSDHTHVRCTTVPGVGTGYRVRIVTGGVESPYFATTLDYAPPSIFSPGGFALGGQGAANAQTSGNQLLTIDGDEFGPLLGNGGATPIVTYGKTGDEITAQDCSVSTVYTQIRCLTSPGTGADLVVKVYIDGQVSNTYGNMSYARPVVAFYTTEWDLNFQDGANTEGGEWVIINGDNFGSRDMNTLELITYGPTGEEYVVCDVRDIVEPAILNVPTMLPSAAPTDEGGFAAATVEPSSAPSFLYTTCGCSIVTDHTQINCTTIPGSGFGHTWLVTVDGQLSTVPTTEYGEPVVDSVVGPVAAKTSGGEAVSIFGRNFGPEGDLESVRVGPSGIEFVLDTCVRIDHRQIDCLTPPGLGTDWYWSVTVSGQANELNFNPGAGLSYAAPVGLVVYPQLQSTAGGFSLSIDGFNFGVQVPDVGIQILFDGDVIPVDGPGGVITTIFPDEIGIYTDFEPSTEVETLTFDAPEMINDVHNRTLSVRSYIRGLEGQTERTVVVGTFEYAGPVISSLQNAVGADIGNFLETSDIEIVGSSFGREEVGRAYINGVECAGLGGDYGNLGSCIVTSWEHDRILLNFVGREGNASVVLGSKTSNSVSFDQFSPILITTDPTYLPNPDGYNTDGSDEAIQEFGNAPANITIAGQNFGLQIGQISITVGGVPAELDLDYGIVTLPSVSGFVTADPIRSVRFFVPVGTGQDNIVIVTRGGLNSFTGDESKNIYVDYRSPTIALATPQLVGTMGGEIITIFGSNFGADEAVVTVTWGAGTTSVDLDIISGSVNQTQMQVLSPEGAGVCRPVKIRVDDLVATSECLFEFEQPILTTGEIPPVDTVGGDFFLFGDNFGPTGTLTVEYVTVAIERRRLLTLPPFTAVVLPEPPQNHTTAHIAIGPGQGAAFLQFNVSGDLSTIPLRYEAPYIESISPNSGATDGGYPVELVGTNFGVGSDFVLAVDGVEVDPDAITNYTHTRITFDLPAGEGFSPQNVTLQVAGQDSNNNVTFTYDPPRVDRLVKNQDGVFEEDLYANCERFSEEGCGLGTEGGYRIGIAGENFGITKPSVVWNGVQLAQSEVRLISHSVISVRVPPGVGTNVSVYITKEDFVSDTLLFDYDPPFVAGVSPNKPNAAGTTIEIEGKNFGFSEASAGNVSIFVGDVPCGQVTLGESTVPIFTEANGQIYLWCSLPRIRVGYQSLNVTVAQQNVFYPEEAQLLQPRCTAGYYGQESWTEDIDMFGDCERCTQESLDCMAYYDEETNTYSDESCIAVTPCRLTESPPLAGGVARNCSVLTRIDEFCVECEIGTTCAEPNGVYPVEPLSVEGYWLASVPGLSLDRCGEDRVHRTECYEVQPCEPAEACVGENMCKRGYTGERCAECCDQAHRNVNDPITGKLIRNEECFRGSTRLEYYRFGGECQKCPDEPLAILILFVSGVLIVAMGAYYLHKNRVNMGILSIGIDYFQILAIFSSTRVEWPASIDQLFTIFSVFNVNLNITAPECIFVVSYRTKWYLIELTPLFILSIFAVLHVLKLMHKFFIKRVHGRRLHAHLHTMIGLSLISMYYLYLFIVANTLEIFNCIEIESEDGVSDGNEYLAAQPSEQCYVDGGLQQELTGPAIFFFILYGIGYPAVVGYILFKPDNTQMIKEDQLLRAMGKGESRATNPNCYEFRKRYSRLYYEFKPQFWFWKLLILGRKLGIVTFALIFRTNPTFQMCMILLVIFSAYALQVRHIPYMSMKERDEVLEYYADDVAFIRDAADKHATAANAVAVRKGVAHLHLGRDSDLEKTRSRVTAAGLANASASYFWNWNTVEAILLICAILINLFGIMFESQYLEDGSADLDALTYTALVVIMLSVIYYGVVVWTEIVAVIFPRLACPFLNTEVHGEEDESIIDDSEFEMTANPQLVGAGEARPQHQEKDDPGTLKMAIEDYVRLKESVKNLTRENLENKKIIKNLTMQNTLQAAPVRQKSKVRKFRAGTEEERKASEQARALQGEFTSPTNASAPSEAEEEL